MSASLDRLRSTPAASASGGQPLAGNSNSNIRQTHNHLGSMGLHKSSHTAGAREVGLMGAMASCAPPNTLLIAAPTPRPCPAPTPLSTAATQTELLMVENSKLESRAEVEISKLKVEIRRLRQRGYERKYKAKLKANNEYKAKRKAYMREYRRKLKARGGLGPEGACRQLAASGA